MFLIVSQKEKKLASPQYVKRKKYTNSKFKKLSKLYFTEFEYIHAGMFRYEYQDHFPTRNMKIAQLHAKL